MNEETKYTISETYELPSKGEIYGKMVNPKITLRAMTARDELRRQNPKALPLMALADLIENCIINKPEIHVYDMATGDYEYLLHKLRTISYGPDYRTSAICPYCSKVTDTTIQLDSLEVKAFDKAEFENLKTFELPISKHTITLNIQTPRLLDEIDSKAKEMQRKTPNADINFETYAQLLLAIDLVDEKKMNSVDLEYFVNELPARDMNKILNRFEKLGSYIGLNNKIVITCPNCGEDINTFFRFGTEFFRPAED